MKKFAIGCLVILVLGGIVLAVGGYFLYRAAAPVIQDARNYLGGMAKLGDLDQRIADRSTYTPPESGELTEEQVQRFARVQDSVRAALGQRMTEIDEKYKRLKGPGNSIQPSFGEAMSALRDLANVVVEARGFQIDGLNREKFSQSEYSWVRARVFQAAGIEATNMIDLKKIGEAVRENTGIDDIKAPTIPTMSVPEKNRALIKPYLDRMDQWIPLAFFGL